MEFVEEISLRVMDTGGKFIDLVCDSSATLLEVKSMIQCESGTPIDQQILIYNGKQLEDCRALRDYNFRWEFPVNLVRRPRGGDPLSIFVELAGNIDTATAEQYLDNSGGNIEAAIQQYFHDQNNGKFKSTCWLCLFSILTLLSQPMFHISL